MGKRLRVETFVSCFLNSPRTVADHFSNDRQGAVGPFGENLAIMSGTNNNVAQAIKMWNDEAPEYNPNSPVASHFTQVVWKDTTELGCAVVACNIASFAGGATSNFYVVSSFLLPSQSRCADSGYDTIV